MGSRCISRFLWALCLLQVGMLEVSGAASLAQGEGPHSKPSTQWRIINLDAVEYGWAVGELKMFSDTTCTADLTKPDPKGAKDADPPITWTAISSGNNNAPATLAFDSLTWTAWRAQCYMCSAGKAWIGLRFSAPVSVFCIQLYQWGKRAYKTDRIMLQHWEKGPAGTTTGWWRDVMKGSQLEGEVMDLVSFTTCEEVSAPDHGRVVVTNGRFYPSDATYRCTGARLMVGGNKQSCLPDGTWTGDIPTCYPAIALIILITSVFTLELICFASYYVMVTRHKPPPLQSATFLPDDCLGKFSSHEIYGVRDKEEDEASQQQQNVLRHVLFCPCCRLADTWQSMGLVPYFGGVWIPQLCFPVLPCIGAYFRSQIRQRFQIHHEQSVTKDFMLWICCCPCVATQEAKQVDKICDIAQEEAEVMRRAEERKMAKDKKIREQIAAKNAIGGSLAATLGKGEGGDEDGKAKEDLKAMGSAEAKKHQTFLEAKSVMDILQSV